MVAHRNMRESEFRKVQRAVKVQQTASPLNNSSVTAPDGQVRIGADGNGGKLKANGDFEWRGQMDTYGPWSNSGDWTNVGDIDNSGDFENSGKFTNNGELEQNGPSNFNGTMDILGLTTLLNNLRVMSGGKITIDGPVPFELINGAAIFANGTEMSGGSFGIRLAASGSTVTAGVNIAGIAAAGNAVTVDGTRIEATGDLRVNDDFQVVGESLLQGPAILQNALVRFPNLPTVIGKGLPAGTPWFDTADDNRLYIALS